MADEDVGEGAGEDVDVRREEDGGNLTSDDEPHAARDDDSAVGPGSQMTGEGEGGGGEEEAGEGDQGPPPLSPLHAAGGTGAAAAEAAAPMQLAPHLQQQQQQHTSFTYGSHPQGGYVSMAPQGYDLRGQPIAMLPPHLQQAAYMQHAAAMAFMPQLMGMQLPPPGQSSSSSQSMQTYSSGGGGMGAMPAHHPLHLANSQSHHGYGGGGGGGGGSGQTRLIMGNPAAGYSGYPGPNGPPGFLVFHPPTATGAPPGSSHMGMHGLGGGAGMGPPPLTLQQPIRRRGVGGRPPGRGAPAGGRGRMVVGSGGGGMGMTALQLYNQQQQQMHHHQQQQQQAAAYAHAMQQAHSAPLGGHPSSSSPHDSDSESAGGGGGGGSEVTEVRWVQCDACGKWRTVPPEVNMDALENTQWVCRMARWDGDLTLRGCNVPEARVDTEADTGGGGGEGDEGSRASASGLGLGLGVSSSSAGPTHFPIPGSGSGSGSSIGGGIGGSGRGGMRGRGRGRGGGRPPSSLATAHHAHASPLLPAHAATTGNTNIGSVGGGGGIGTSGLGVPPPAKRRRRAKAAEGWVQCDACTKWRKFTTDIVSEKDLPESWTCEMNYWDPAHAYCDAPDEAAEASGGGGSGGGGATASEGLDAGGGNSNTGVDAYTAGGETVRLERFADSESGGVGVEASAHFTSADAPPHVSSSALGFAPSHSSHSVAPDNESASGGGIGVGVVGGGMSGVLEGESEGAPTAAGIEGGYYETSAGEVAGRKRRRPETAATATHIPHASPGGTTVAHATGIARVGSGGGGSGNSGNLAPARGTPRLTIREREPELPVLFRAHKPSRGSVAADDPIAAYPTADRRGALPPAYTHGQRDFHHMLLFHPPEVWGDPNAAGGVARDQIRGAWNTAIAAGPNVTVQLAQHAKISYRDLISASWGSRTRASTQLGERGVPARESHLRWSRSSMYAASAEAVELANGGGGLSAADVTSLAAGVSSAVVAQRAALAKCVRVQSGGAGFTSATAPSGTSLGTISSSSSSSFASALLSVASTTSPSAARSLAHLCACVHTCASSAASGDSASGGGGVLDASTRLACLQGWGALISSVCGDATTASPPLNSLTLSKLSVAYHLLGTVHPRMALLRPHLRGGGGDLPSVPISALDVVIAALSEGGKWGTGARALSDARAAATKAVLGAEVAAASRASLTRMLQAEARARRRAEAGDDDAVAEDDTGDYTQDVDPGLLAELLAEAAQGERDKIVTRPPTHGGELDIHFYPHTAWAEYAVGERAASVSVLALLLASALAVESTLAAVSEDGKHANYSGSGIAGFVGVGSTGVGGVGVGVGGVGESRHGGLTARAVSQLLQGMCGTPDSSSNASGSSNNCGGSSSGTGPSLYAQSRIPQGCGELACEVRLRALVLAGLVEVCTLGPHSNHDVPPDDSHHHAISQHHHVIREAYMLKPEVVRAVRGGSGALPAGEGLPPPEVTVRLLARVLVEASVCEVSSEVEPALCHVLPLHLSKPWRSTPASAITRPLALQLTDTLLPNGPTTPSPDSGTGTSRSRGEDNAVVESSVIEEMLMPLVAGHAPE